jgi:hypothetical protein
MPGLIDCPHVSAIRNVAAVMNGGDWVRRRVNLLASVASAKVFQREVS